VQFVGDDDRQEKEEIDYFKTKLVAYLNPQQTKAEVPAPTRDPPPSSRRQRDNVKVKQPDKETKEKMLGEIKKHIDLRFELLNELLTNNDKIIVIIPGSCTLKDGYYYFEHSLGTDIAQTQWKGIDLEKAGAECIEYIGKKIDTLIDAFRLPLTGGQRVLYGNIGTKPDENETFLPQFPLYAEGLENLKTLFSGLKNENVSFF
jgi:hypothetical protein